MKRLIAAFLFVVSAGCHRTGPKLEKTITPVRVAAVDLYQPKSGGRYSASILPGRQVSLSFRVSGIVSGVHRLGGRNLEPGDMVAGGTVLARLREEDYKITSAQAQSTVDAARQTQRSAAFQLAQAQASRTKAEADFARAKTLLDSQSLTRPEFDSAKAQLDVTGAQVDAARAQLESATAQIRTTEASLASARLAQGDTALVAPFTSSVVQRNVEVGMMTGPSQPAYTLADISTVKAAFGVPDTVVVQLKPGKSIDISVEALPGREFRGRGFGDRVGGRLRNQAVPGGGDGGESPDASETRHDRFAPAGGRRFRRRGARNSLERGDARPGESGGLLGDGRGKQDCQGQESQPGADLRRRPRDYGRDQAR